MVPTATLTRADFSQPAYALFTANEVGEYRSRRSSA
jgi:hypothetical protein